MRLGHHRRGAFGAVQPDLCRADAAGGPQGEFRRGAGDGDDRRPRRAIIRNSGASPGPPSAPSSFRANSTPTGTFRRVNLAIRSRSHSVSDRPWLISRGFQSGAARRTSSWCTKNSTVLASSSSAEMDHGDSRAARSGSSRPGPGTACARSAPAPGRYDGPAARRGCPRWRPGVARAAPDAPPDHARSSQRTAWARPARRPPAWRTARAAHPANIPSGNRRVISGRTVARSRLGWLTASRAGA